MIREMLFILCYSMDYRDFSVNSKLIISLFRLRVGNFDKIVGRKTLRN